MLTTIINYLKSTYKHWSLNGLMRPSLPQTVSPFLLLLRMQTLCSKYFMVNLLYFVGIKKFRHLIIWSGDYWLMFTIMVPFFYADEAAFLGAGSCKS